MPYYTDVKADRHGSYYYNPSDFEMVELPIADESEGIRLPKERLKEWFGIESL